jgi:hypothetical protein
MHYSGQKQVKSIKTKTTQQSAENTSLHIQDENQFTYKKNTHKVQRKIFYAFFRPKSTISEKSVHNIQRQIFHAYSGQKPV